MQKKNILATNEHIHVHVYMCMFMYVLLHIDVNSFYNIKPEIVKSGDDHVIYLPVSCDD